MELQITMEGSGDGVGIEVACLIGTLGVTQQVAFQSLRVRFWLRLE